MEAMNAAPPPHTHTHTRPPQLTCSDDFAACRLLAGPVLLEPPPSSSSSSLSSSMTSSSSPFMPLLDGAPAPSPPSSSCSSSLSLLLPPLASLASSVASTPWEPSARDKAPALASAGPAKLAALRARFLAPAPGSPPPRLLPCLDASGRLVTMSAIVLTCTQAAEQKYAQPFARAGCADFGTDNTKLGGQFSRSEHHPPISGTPSQICRTILRTQHPARAQKQLVLSNFVYISAF